MRPIELALPEKVTKVKVILAVGSLACLILLAVYPTDWSVLPTKLQYQIATDPAGKTRLGLQLADRYVAKGALDEAVHYYTESSRLAAKSGDLESRMRSTTGLGQVYATRNQAKLARDSIAESIVSARKLIMGGNSSLAVRDSICKTLVLLRKITPEDSYDAVRSAIEISDAYISKNQFEHARVVLEPVSTGADHVTRIGTLIKHGEISLRAGKRAQAERAFDDAVALMPTVEDKVRMLELESDKALLCSDTAFATHLLEVALRTTTEISPTYFVRLKLKLAHCYSLRNNLPEAQRTYAEALAAARVMDVYPECQILIVRSLDGVGQIQYRRANFRGAETSFSEELSVLKRPVWDYLPDRLLLMARADSMLGDSLTCQSKYCEAAAEFRRVIEICNSAPPTEEIRTLLASAREKQRSNEFKCRKSKHVIEQS